MSDFHPQTELSQKDLARLLREAKEWVSKGEWTETTVRLATYCYRDAAGQIVHKQILAIDLHYIERGERNPTTQTFTPLRCPKCGRVFLAHPHWDAEMGCFFKDCDRKAAEIERMTRYKPGGIHY
jgi:hypothetical protein